MSVEVCPREQVLLEVVEQPARGGLVAHELRERLVWHKTVLELGKQELAVSRQQLR